MFQEVALLPLIFIFGLIIGSFLNVVILRLKKEESLGGRSYCVHCSHTLAWYDLLPLVSYFLLSGRCRYCHVGVSIQYPLVELLTGLLFVAIATFQLESFHWQSLVVWWYLGASLIVIFIYDLRYYIIPDMVLFPAIVITAGYQFLSQGFTGFIPFFIAAITASAFFLVIFLMSKGAWMGFGDVKLAILMGLILGFPAIITALFLAFLIGAIIGVIVISLEKIGIGNKGLKSELPFAPFLIVGTFAALWFSPAIIYAYLSLLYV